MGADAAGCRPATAPPDRALTPMGISHLLIHAAVWSRNATGSDRGQHGFAPVVLDPALRCRMSPTSAGKVGIVTEQDVATNYYKVYTEPGVDLQHDDVLLINGIELRVEAHQPPSVPDHHEEFVCSEVESAAP